jgi:predicted  nucleic acid-binding Zn-ribbon protein|tara:strand:- start:15 stop:500 length:486 start_codon:yes stop_codon:yes gene_type:complete
MHKSNGEPAVEHELNIVKTDVEILKKDVSNIQGLLSRLDTAIDKIAVASNDISKMLAVHDNKHQDTSSELHERRRQTENNLQAIHERISGKEREMGEVMDAHLKRINKALTDHDERSAASFAALFSRMDKMEVWKWLIVGGGCTMGFLFGLESSVIISLFS